jgi:hypothetical protein
MENPKVLVTAGCSFSQVNNRDVTWPIPLNNYLKPEKVLYLGQGAAGNGIISRKVIYHVTELLKTYKPEEILVGIMWSGKNRMEVYSRNAIPHEQLNHSDDYCNPVKLAKDNNFYILNNHWSDESTLTYFKHFYDEAYATILTLEHMLRVQWFLKGNNIKFFMTQFHPDCLPLSNHPYDVEVMANPDVSHLFKLLDLNYWLPISNMWQYATDSGVPFARPPDPHPSTEHHQLLVSKVVVPWLKNKGFIN